MSRPALIAKVEACIGMLGSNSVPEALSAVDRARELVARYEIATRELSPAAVRSLSLFGAAAWLSLQGIYTRWAAEADGARDQWDVTRLGRITEDELLQHAASKGCPHDWVAFAAEDVLGQ